MDEDDDMQPAVQIQSPELRAILERTRAVVGSPEWKASAEKLALRAAEAKREQEGISTLYRRKVARIPPEFSARFATAEDRPALQAAQEFMAGDKQLLVLAGEGGVGKSFAVAWCVEQGGTEAEYIQAGQLAQHGSYEPLFWRRLSELKVLGINELGQERVDGSGWYAGAFCDLMDMRLAGKRRTVFSTNLSGPAFMKRYAEGDFARLARRWKEYGRFMVAPRSQPEPGSAG